MKDKRFKWIDTRWGKSSFVFFSIVGASLLSYFFKFISPDIVAVRPTLIGNVSIWFVMVLICSLFGLLMWWALAMVTPRYNEYVTMEKPYLIPYNPTTGEIYHRVGDSAKLDIEWRGNLIWQDIMTVEPFNDYFLRLVSDRDKKRYLMLCSDAHTILSVIKDNKVEGNFTYKRFYTRHDTFYVVEYIDKMKFFYGAV